MKLEIIADEKGRFELDEQRLAAWGSFLSPEGFHGRQKRLYDHPYGKGFITHYAYRDGSGRIVTSMEVLTIQLQVRDGNGAVSERKAGLIASVVTPVELRGKGHATAMLREYFEGEGEWSGILFSDIAPEFYERFGFTSYPVGNIEKTVGEPGVFSDRAEAMLFDDFLRAFRKIRRKILDGADVPSAVVYPEALFIDWELERFRYFAELSKKKMPDTLFWRVTHPEKVHLLMTFPDFVNLRLNAMWAPTGCDQCKVFLGRLAAQWGMKTYRYWERRGAPEGVKLDYPYPMIRTPEGQVAFTDIQFCDWF